MAIQQRVVIIGGGISGLSAAWTIEKQARAGGLDVQYTILEQSNRWGGKIRTEQVDGFGDPFVVEAGPDSFLTQKPWALDLARELGLESELLGTSATARRVFVLHHGKPMPMPDGVMLIVPSKLMPFALTPLLSPLGKLRMGLEFLIPRKEDSQDETLADFVRRRLGSEALDKIAEPLLSGIYSAEAERQSLLATFPRFRELENKHGSLLRGMLASRRAGPSQNGHAQTPGTNGHRPPISAFVSFRSGTEALVHALIAQLTGDLRLNIKVQTIDHASDGSYNVVLEGGECINADTVIVTTPAYVAADLVRNLVPEAAADLDAIRYVSTGTISLAYRRSDIAHPLDGSGIVIPRSEKRPINAITWTSSKFSQRAPEDYVLMRVFFGGSRTPATLDLDDDRLVEIVRDELEALLGIRADPVFHRIYRWHRANPQYDVGHLERVATLESRLPTGLFITGCAYRGVGIPDCVHQAEQVAVQVVQRVRECS